MSASRRALPGAGRAMEGAVRGTPAGSPGSRKAGRPAKRALKAGLRRRRSRNGQMTVELAVAFPVLLVIVVISVNALVFFSDCAVFDRVMHEAVRVHATSPAYRQGTGQTASLVEQEIRAQLGASNLDVAVSSEVVGADFVKYSATLSYSPTLFGMGLKRTVFGVPLPQLTHRAEYVVDTYKPGVVV